VRTLEWVWILVLYQIVQVLVLLSQDIFGPRWFVPSSLFPDDDRWDWHPALPAVDVESDVPRHYDCAICFERIDVNNNNEESGEKDELLSGVGRGLNRFSYMVTFFLCSRPL
jgi:hypothetical protein